MSRSGTYPPPPYWPAQLATDLASKHRDPLHWFYESEGVRHVYLADGCPGPCRVVFEGEDFLSWHPHTTIERAERP